jgi:molybdate transport system substrate-binding protein
MTARRQPWDGGRTGRALGALAILIVVAAGPPGIGPARAAPAGPISVFAAASLAAAFTVLGKVFEERMPGLRVAFTFAGSQQLAQQIEGGAPADVFAAADPQWMKYLQQRGLILGTPQEFARNRLVLIIPGSNPGKIAQLQDLARPGLKLVIQADAVPAGHATREALAKLSRAPGAGPDFSQRVLRNVVSEEDNGQDVLAKIQRGEADAGALYRSDLTQTVSDTIAVIDIPDAYNVLASYPIALVKGGSASAQLFVALVLSPMGQQFLWGFNLVPAVRR